MAYRATLANGWGIPSTAVWGSDPESYPVMVDTLRMTSTRLISFYVYPSAARALLAALPEHADVGRTSDSAPRQRDPNRNKKRHPETPVTLREFNAAMSAQKEFNLSTAAHVLTMIKELERVGICKDGEYNRAYLANLAAVDEWNADDIHHAILQRPTEA